MNPTKIAFVSCAYATLRPKQPAWDEIAAAKPDLLLMMGDNAYMSWTGTDWRPQALEDCYRAQFDVTGFKELIKRVPTLAVWDDHDCGPDDTLGAEAPPADLAATRAMFDRWMAFARNDNRPHMYCTYDELPDVRVIMLDVRTYRTSSQVKGATLLGAAQEDWLWSCLDPAVTPQRRFTIIVSGSGFSMGKPGHRVSSYRTFARRLRREMAFRAGSGGADVGRRALFLAGDVHYNAFRTHGDEGFHEVISSGVACFRAKTTDFTRASESDNWGLVTIGDDVRIDFHGNDRTPDTPGPVTIGIDDWKAAAA